MRPNLKINAYVQARMGSTRLPGKILKKLYNKSVIEHIIDRLKKLTYLNRIIVGTTTRTDDDKLCELLTKHLIPFVRHKEDNDLLGRFNLAIKEFPADYFIKINADCPIVDLNLINQGVSFLMENPQYDLVTNRKKQTFPLGLSYEIIKVSAVRFCLKKKLSKVNKELFVNWMFDNENIFKTKNFLSDIYYGDINLCLDTIKDYEVLNSVFCSLWDQNNFFGLKEISFLIKNSREKYVF